MAKKKTSASLAAADGDEKKTVVADGYKLDIHRNMDDLILTFDLVVAKGDDRFTLRVNTLDSQTSLIQTLLRRIADVWPARDLTIKVQDGAIVG